MGRLDLQRCRGGGAGTEGAVGTDRVVLPPPARDEDQGFQQGVDAFPMETRVAPLSPLARATSASRSFAMICSVVSRFRAMPAPFATPILALDLDQFSGGRSESVLRPEAVPWDRDSLLQAGEPVPRVPVFGGVDDRDALGVTVTHLDSTISVNTMQACTSTWLIVSMFCERWLDMRGADLSRWLAF